MSDISTAGICIIRRILQASERAFGAGVQQRVHCLKVLVSSIFYELTCCVHCSTWGIKGPWTSSQCTAWRS